MYVEGPTLKNIFAVLYKYVYEVLMSNFKTITFKSDILGQKKNMAILWGTEISYIEGGIVLVWI